MIGVKAYGIYLPYYYIKRETIYGSMGWFNPGLGTLASGEKAVANHDEDTTTLAVAAGMDCLADASRADVKAFFLASTTFPYKERSNASIAATALNLDPETRTAEFSGAVKAGTAALISAVSEADSGLKLVAAADCRLGKAGGSQEALFGDAAAAFVIGGGDVLASCEGHYSLSFDFADNRRIDDDQFVRTWEERWIREEGYTNFIPKAVNGLLQKCGIKLEDVAKVAFPPINARDHAAVAKMMGLNKEQIQDPMIASVGLCGAAHPLLMFASALEKAKPGDNIVVVGYGSGCDALLFRVTEAITELKNREKITKSLEFRREMVDYTKYLSFKGMLAKEAGIRGEEIAATSLSLTWREKDAVLRLAGGKCLECGTPQFPRESVCINPSCGSINRMEDYAFSDKTGRLFTYTADHLTYSEDPPSLYGIVDFDGGGRYWFDIADCTLESLSVNQPVQMTFRRKYKDKQRSLFGYFWKAMPFKY